LRNQKSMLSFAYYEIHPDSSLGCLRCFSRIHRLRLESQEVLPPDKNLPGDEKSLLRQARLLRPLDRQLPGEENRPVEKQEAGSPA